MSQDSSSDRSRSARRARQRKSSDAQPRQPNSARNRNHSRERSDQWLRDAKLDLARGARLPALEKLDRVICQGRPNLETWVLAGGALLDLGEYAQALDACQHALAIDANDATANFQCAAAEYQLGNVHQAVTRFRQLAERTQQLNAWCNLATIIPGDPEASGADIRSVRTEFARRLHQQEQLPGEPTGELAPLADPRSATATSPLRVGYVSAYFGDANYMRPVWNLIQQHDRSRVSVQLFADSCGPAELAWFEPGPYDRVAWSTDLTNFQLAAAIRAARLDLVIDLNGYSVPQRLGLWTYRLAPATAAWFNMYATSGLPKLDYLIGDPWVVPAGEEPWFSETIARLPCSYLSFGEPTIAAPPLTAPPGLVDDIFTFGSLVSQYKLTPQVLDLWSAILTAVPRSRLRLGNRALGSTVNRTYVQAALARRGIPAERLEFLPPAPNTEFLAHYNRIDLALDAFPYNGGTTTTESLWQGVPVLALAGDRWAARTSQTLLVNAGLADFVARDLGHYQALAVAWSQQVERLANLRARLRDDLRRSSLCRPQGFARDFEAILAELVAQDRT